jgi:spermidine synthase
VAGALMLPGFRALEALDARLWALSPAWAPLLHLTGVALLLAPPTIAMGATVPVFQLVARSHGTPISVLYGMNTAGAAVGVLLLTFALLPSLGVTAACALIASLNATVFVASRWLPAGTRAPAPAPAPGPAASAAIHPAWARVVVFGTGFATFGLEVAWFRALRAAFWSTSATFAILLAAVLIPLAAGARAVPWMRRRGIGPGEALVGAGTAVLLASPLVERMDLAAHLSGSYALVLVASLGLCLAVLGPAVFLLATALPWFLEELPEPHRSGQLYALNTLGAVAGALTGAWLLLPAFGFARSAWLLGLLVVGLALPLCARRARLAATVAAGAALLLAAGIASSPGRERMYGERDLAGYEILALEEGPDFTTTVVDSPDGMRVLLIDGFAASSDWLVGAHYMEWMGSLPALLHTDPERGLVICFGTGRTANAVRREGVARLDVVDVSAAVLELAPLFPVNEGVLEDPRVEAIVMDGRAWLRRTDRRYQVITLEPMPPNFSGMNALYSKEFYEIAAARLAPGGVVAQWLPLHLLDPHHAASVAATFQSVLPDAILWIDPFGGGTGILLGRAAGEGRPLGSDWPGLARPGGARTLSEAEIARGVLLGPDELARYAARGTIITDDNQLLAWSSLRAGLRGARRQANARENLRILSQIAGREPYYLDRRDARQRARSAVQR